MANITPANKLPTVILSTGIYLTRNGTKINIHDIKDHSDDLTVTRFNCKGSIERMFRGKPRFKGLDIWHESGMYKAVGKHDLDIIGKVLNV